MNQEVQVLDAAEEVVTNPSLNAKQKGLIIGTAVLTGGLAIAGFFLFKHLKAKKLANKPADEKAEGNE